MRQKNKKNHFCKGDADFREIYKECKDEQSKKQKKM